jgi:hypothetical protein
LLHLRHEIGQAWSCFGQGVDVVLDEGKVARLNEELVGVRKGRGLREAGRISECPLLIKTAANICHPNGEKGEPLLDALRVLMDAVQEFRRTQ